MSSNHVNVNNDNIGHDWELPALVITFSDLLKFTLPVNVISSWCASFSVAVQETLNYCFSVCNVFRFLGMWHELWTSPLLHGVLLLITALITGNSNWSSGPAVVWHSNADGRALKVMFVTWKIDFIFRTRPNYLMTLWYFIAIVFTTALGFA